MAALPDLITVAQFRELPEDGKFVYELHHGEVVALTRPKGRDWDLQWRLCHLLESRLKTAWVVGPEMPYRPVAEFDLRVADVAATRQDRYLKIDPSDNLRSAPELVIEVKSPSNSRKQLQELAALCLANGAREFWIVDADARTVSVMHREGTAVLYPAGDSVPLTAFDAAGLPVDEIFG